MDENANTVPQWVADGSWQPWYLTAIRLIRRNIFLLFVLVAFYSQGYDRYVVMALPVAVLFDYILSKVSWISNTRPEAIFRALTTDHHDHVYESFLEVSRREYPIATYLLFVVALGAPAAVYVSLGLGLPNIFKFYYLFYAVLISSPFAFTAYSTRNKNVERNLSPLVYAKKYGLLGLRMPAAIAVESLCFLAPGVLAIWGLLYGATGFSPAHLGGVLICWGGVHYLYKAEYNISLHFIDSHNRSLVQESA